MGSRKTRLIVRNDAEISAKVRTSEALARRAYQNAYKNKKKIRLIKVGLV